MRVYQNYDVTITYQNFGSTWLCILRGSENDIKLVFNGLYNFMATNGDYEFYDGAKTVALFWSSEKNMRRFFENQYSFPREVGNYDKAALAAESANYAEQRLLTLRENHEAFFAFQEDRKRSIMDRLEGYNIGRICAERPDNDFKDSVIGHAFQNHDNVRSITKEMDATEKEVLDKAS